MSSNKQRFFAPVNRGISQTTFLFFITGLFLLVSYFYFISYAVTPRDEIAAPVTPQSKLGLTFIHPVYGYSLDLPFWWRDRYQVTERGNSTNFYYLPARLTPAEQTGLFTSTNFPVRLFSILVLKKTSAVPNGKKIGEQGENSFWLETARETIDLNAGDKADWQKMVDEIPAVGRSFKIVLNNQGITLREFITRELDLHGPNTLPVLSYETLATQETSSSTKIFLWLAVSQYAWQENDLIKINDISTSLIAWWQKDDQTGYSLKSLMVPRSGRSYQSELGKLFPASVVKNSILKNGTPEHDSLLQKLSDELDASVLAYFGHRPVLTKYGWLRKFNEDNNNLIVTVDEVDIEKLPVGTTTVNSRLSKCLPSAVSCQFADYRIRNSDQTLYRYVVASSTRAVLTLTSSSPQDHLAVSPVALADFINAFLSTSTSSLKNGIYRLGLLDDKVVSINSI